MKFSLYNGCHQVQGTVGQQIDDLDLEMVALSSAVSAGKYRKCPVDPTLFALIIGPGNVSTARVELQHGDWIRRFQ